MDTASLLNRHFLWFLVAFAAAELLSVLGFLHPGVGTVLALGISGGTLVLAVVNLRWAVYLLLGELFIGGKGYLFSLPLGPSSALSIRMMLFLVVVGVGLSHLIFRNRFPHSQAVSPVHKNRWVLALGAAVMYGLIIGLTRHPFAQVFFDANGWLFFLLLPVLYATLRVPDAPARLMQLLGAAIVMLAVKSAVLVYLFGHAASDSLVPLYQWIRNTGVGEITHVSGTLFRIFFQSHLYSLIGFLVIFTLLVHHIWQRWPDLAVAGALLYSGSLTLLISQSRSLWIGGATGVAVVLGHAMIRRKLTVTSAVLAIGALVSVLASQLTVVNLLSGNVGGNVISNRFADLGAEPASSTRKSQLGPLVTAIKKNPWLGSGFGQAVTYQSSDPRIARERPGGWYTTTAFEWGYLDIALKLGLVGLIVYAAWMARVVWLGLTPGASPVPAAAVIGLVGVAVTNVFSPYLNHPLGIGWLMVTMAVVQAGQRMPPVVNTKP